MISIRSGRRVLATVAATAALSAVAVGVAAGPASASTISNGFVQVCAQGKYAAYATFPYRGGFSTTVVNPGDCWYGWMGGDSWEPIDVYGIYPGSPKPIDLGEVWYNGSVSGIGIGAEGTTDNYYYYTW
ncbi:hypothetical protein [Streptacidiphilus sp. EB129]|jgi:hypothetical protein|uniref:hypothetical protein n=1 Tax=Streptacidiphilus sp. EB129 TaxID=3156262 RepID=UPI0035137DC6